MRKAGAPARQKPNHTELQLLFLGNAAATVVAAVNFSPFALCRLTPHCVRIYCLFPPGVRDKFCASIVQGYAKIIVRVHLRRFMDVF
jgi:hypothetical protein